MQRKGKQSITYIQSRKDVVDTQTKLKMLDHSTKIKINGHELTVAQYMEDPQKYNTTPMSKEYLEQVKRDCERSLYEKNLFKCNPSYIDGYKNID